VKLQGKFGKAIRITGLGLLAVLVLLFGGGFIYYQVIARAPLPQIDGELSAKGLKDRVEILRDSHGVPHIYAKNMHDVFFAQGYVQAQDRWWQMEFYRKTCGGRIEELTGKKSALVAPDIYLRSLGLYGVCRREYESYTPAERAPLDAFAAGVNAYIAGKKPRQLSVNYALLGLTGVKFNIEPWTPIDSLMFSKIMAWDLGLRRDPELLRTRLYEKLGAKMAEAWLIPPWPIGEKPTTLTGEDIKALFGGTVATRPPGEGRPAPAQYAGKPVSGDDTPDFGWMGGGHDGAGSNSWVATGKMTKSGRALLANDPHLGIQMPSIWYEVALHATDDGTGRPFDVQGFTFSSNPGVVVGHNADISWGTTNVYPDVNDQYMIRVNPKNPLQYRWNGTWRDMTTRKETIAFGNGKPAIEIIVRVTHLGPIINDNKYDPETGTLAGFNNEDPRALRWTALEPGRIALAIIGLNKARNWKEFRAALKNWDVPSQSIIYADTNGNIGFQMPGKIPIRPAGLAGQVPTPGWGSEYEWKGYIPYDLMPRAFNPAGEFMVAANQEVAPPEYYATLNARLGGAVNANFGSRYNKWIYGYRAQRITEMIRQSAPHTPATYRAMQNDVVNLSAAEVLPALEKLEFKNGDLAAARDWLMQWDRRFGEESPQAVLYAMFWKRLTGLVFQDKLGDVAKSDAADKEMWAMTLLLANPDDAWWDDSTTKDKTETRDEVLVRAFREGYEAAVAALGKNRSKWRWSDLHGATFVSNPLGASKIGLLEKLVNRGPVPVGGSTECVNNNMWDAGTGDFSVRMIPSMRMIVDMNDFSGNISINSTGQSGHPKSPWYGDMIEPWRKGTFRPMLWTRQQADKGARHTLVLRP
jgi:penicillin amidase